MASLSPKSLILRILPQRFHPRTLSLSLALAASTILVANAQIANTKPGHLKAENRRALREARHTDAPNKESHLNVTKDQLKRGSSDAPQPKGADELRYNKEGIAIPPKRGFLGTGRKKK